MGETLFFENINILKGPNVEVAKDHLLIIDGKITAFGDLAKKEPLQKNIAISQSGNKLVAPTLVDSHSFLKDPLITSSTFSKYLIDIFSIFLLIKVSMNHL